MVDTDILDQISEGSDILGRFENAISNLSSVIDRLTRGVEGGKNAISVFTEGIQKAKEATDGIVKSSKQNIEVSNILGKSLGDLTSQTFQAIKANQGLASVGVDTVLSIEMLTKGTTGLGDSLKDYSGLSEQANKATTRFADTVGTFLPGNMRAAVQNFTKVINQVKTFENSIMSAAQTGGNFYQTYYEGGGTMVEQNESVMNKVARQAADTGNILGIHFEDANKMILDVMKTLPGEFGKIYDEIIVGAEKYSMTTEQIIGRMTRGIGISTEDGLKIAKEMLYTFGEDAVGAAERMAVLSKASKEAGVAFEDLGDLAASLDSTFAMWGDQLEGMVPILNDVSKALEGTNVGIKGQMTLIKNLGSAVAQMNLPMKSFVGVMSGMRSPGGAIGVGLNIERMIQEGRTGEIVSMMQETMQRMTGRGAVSLQEATEDTRAQRAFLVQRGLMQQMTGIGDTGDTGELNRLLEVMSNVELGTAGSVDAQNALSEAMQNGQDIASKQTDIMATVSENMKALESTLVATNKLYREYIDRVTPMGRDRDIMTEPFAEQAMERQAATIGFAREDLTGEHVQQLMQSTAGEMFQAFSTAFVDQVSVGGGIFKNSLQDLSDALEATGNQSLMAFGQMVDVATEKLGGFGDLYDAMKQGIDENFGFTSAAGMPEVIMPDPPKIEVEPIKMTLDLNINDEDGNTMVSKVYEIVSTAMSRISRGD